jgi:hypothetical protein
MRNKRAGLRQEASAERAQADEAVPLVHPAARRPHAEEISHLERYARGSLPRSRDFDQSGNRASTQDQAFTSTSWLAGHSSESDVIGARSTDC